MAQRICPVCGLKTGDASCPECNNATIIERRDEIEVQSLAGKVFNKKYRIEELLGKGGMGSVYRGVNVNVNQKVAVKVMHRELIESQDQVRRFCNEARLSCMLAHPNTLNVYDFGESDEGFLFIVMEYLKGKPLSKVIKEESPLAAGRVLNMAISVARSLAEAHEKGIVHRDLKPENIMLLDFVGQKDFVKVLDFGIAKIVSGGSGESSITKTGMLIGTPKYMSPEQIKSLPLDGRSDIYSLGVIMYQALTGNLPFTGDTPVSVLMSHVNEDVPPFPENLMIGKPLQEIVFRLLEKEREKRPHAWELIGMLERELDRIRPLLNYEQESETAQNRTMKLRGEDGAGMPGGKIFKAIAAIMLVATAGFLFQHYFRSEDKKTIEGTPPAAIKESDASIYEKDTAGVETESPKPHHAEKKPAVATGESAIIPAGEFLMGCAEGDSACEADEKPARKVFIKEFLIDRTEVTAGEFQKCVEAGKCVPENFIAGANNPGCNLGLEGRGGHPMNCVNWAGADEYCKWKGKRLPTEAEWEKAAKGGNEARYPWGNDFIAGAANSGEEKQSDGFQQTTEAASFQPNGYGLFDVAGNVLEWVSDWYGKTYYKKGGKINPPGTQTGTHKILRGGSWSSGKHGLRVSARLARDPGERYLDFGFRCAEDLKKVN